MPTRTHLPLHGVALLAALALGACSTEVATESIQLPQSWLAERLDVSPDDVRIVLADEREWRDSCLGLGGPAESCLAVMTPGWQFILEAKGELFEVRADESGGVLRSPQFDPPPAGAPGEAAAAGAS